jgi:hypothetical protein
MHEGLAIATLTGLYPLARAWSANGTTTLRPALVWTTAALLAWAVAALESVSPFWPYLAMCLSGCAGVAVLGARRPGGGAWNFVVGGLLVVFLMPVATGLGTPRLEVAHLVFLGVTLGVVLVNHLPTRLGLAAPFLAVAFGLEMARLGGLPVATASLYSGQALLALAPWVAWAAVRRVGPLSETNRLWVGFRDRYGFLWAQRIREQFNRSAAHSGQTVYLSWSGLRPAGVRDDDAADTLRALLKRFSRR